MDSSKTMPRTPRDARLDVLRGLALATIFINHVPGNAYEQFTSRNFGFSDAAEAFVLMSGIAAGLAYARGFSQMPFTLAAGRMWARARKLYIVHLIIIAMAVVLLGAGFAYFGTEDLARRTNFLRIVNEPAGALVGVFTLGHQLAYFNILPLYVVLLMMAPAFIMVGRRNLWAMIGLSGAIWFLAGTYKINIPNFPGDGGWFFNPFAWQFVFVFGLAIGMAAKRGEALVAFNRHLFAAACAFLLFSLVWLKMRMGNLPGSDHVPFFLGGFNKSYLPLPRLLHVLALAYVIVNLPLMARLARSHYARPLEQMGRNGLAVFASGSVIAIALQVYGEVVPTNFLDDTALLATGLLIQYWIATTQFSGSLVTGMRPWPMLRPQEVRERSEPRKERRQA